MKDSIIFVLSELFIYFITFCIVILLYPTIPLQIAFIVAVIIYVFATLVTLMFNFSAKKIVDAYFKKKDIDG